MIMMIIPPGQHSAVESLLETETSDQNVFHDHLNLVFTSVLIKFRRILNAGRKTIRVQVQHFYDYLPIL